MQTEDTSACEMDASTSVDVQHPVEISVTDYKISREHSCTKLHEILDDPQSRFIQAAADTFEFQITVPIKLNNDDPNRQFKKEEGKIEGILRYHPFSYTKETYPVVCKSCLMDIYSFFVFVIFLM